ncbi:MAG: hypothetical protein JO127_05105 [Caulobacteraceae bacterium]|nr:hypothetical protein [Caulobacteraceae bacterium]
MTLQPKAPGPDSERSRGDPPRSIVGVGASGSAGLHDLRTLLAAWPPACPAAVMVVLHRPADRQSQLPAVLRSAASIPVVVAHQGAAVSPGVCYLGEPDAHLTLDAAGRIDLTPNSLHRNRTIDLLRHSLAEHAAPNVMGVILSGSLDDGARGLAAIAKAGGATMTVSPDGAYGGQMPQNAVERCGSVDFRGEPAEIAREVGRRTSVGVRT